MVAAAAAGAAAAQADDAWEGGVVPGGGATRADDVKRRGRLGSMASVALSEAEKVYIVHGVQVAAAGSTGAGLRVPLALRVDAGPRLARKDCGRLGLPLIRPLCGRHVQL